MWPTLSVRFGADTILSIKRLSTGYNQPAGRTPDQNERRCLRTDPVPGFAHRDLRNTPILDRYPRKR